MSKDSQTKIWSDVFVSFIIQIATKIRGLILIPLLSVSYGMDTYGAFVQVVVVTTVLVTVFNFASQAALVYRAQAVEGLDRLYYSLLVLVIVSCLIPTAVVYTFAPDISLLLLQSTKYATVFRIGSLLVLVQGTLKLAYNYYRATHQVKLYNLYKAASAYTSILAMAVVVFVLDGGLPAVMAAFVLAEATVYVTLQADIVRSIGVARPAIGEAVTALRYSLPLVGSLLAERASERGDRLIIGMFLGATAVGVYSAAYQLARFISTLSVPLTSTFFPALSQQLTAGDSEKSGELFGQGMHVYLLVAVPAVAGMSIVGPEILAYMATEQAATAATVLLPIVTVGVLFSGIERLFEVVVKSGGRTKTLGVIRAGTATMNILANVLLVPSFGILGAASATILAYLLSTIGLSVVAHRMIPILIDLRFLFAVTSATLGMSAVLVLSGLTNPVVVIPIGVVSYSILILLIGGTTTREMRSLVSELDRLTP